MCATLNYTLEVAPHSSGGVAGCVAASIYHASCSLTYNGRFAMINCVHSGSKQPLT